MATYSSSQEGIRSGYGSTKYSNDNLFTGVWRLGSDNISNFDPFIQGYAQFVWTQLPAIMSAKGAVVPGGIPSEFAANFKALTERNFKSFSGLSNITLEQEEMSAGFAGNTLPVATTIKKENTQFTLKHYELAGSPIREGYQWWVSAIRDPETGIATYHGADLPYSMKSHTGELMYYVTDPSFATHDSGNSSSIEFAAYYTNVFPTTIPMDHLNYNSGDHGLTEIDIEFRGCFHAGGEINKLATSIAAKYKITKEFLDYGTGDKTKYFSSSAETMASGLGDLT